MPDEQFALDDFRESYAQYRHLEAERSRHLAFFFSALFAGIALLGSLAGAKVKPVTLMITATATTSVLQILAVFVYAVVRKIRFARARQLRVISTVRRTMLPEEHPVRDVWRATGAEVRLQPFSVQRMAELMLLAAWLILAVAGVASPTVAIVTAGVSPGLAAGPLFASAAIAAGCLAVFARARRGVGRVVA